MDIYTTDFCVDTKQDNTPVTQADLAAHRCLVDGLIQLTPRLPVLSEEGTEIPFAIRRQWPRYWLLDPLDGTKEFIKQNGEFTVNIALIEDHRPMLGVVHAPALNISYFSDHSGAWKLVSGVRQKISTRPNGPSPDVLVSRSHQDSNLYELLDRIGPHKVTSRGSSLKFCLIAEGAADLHLRTGPTSEWDTAAGQAIVEAAGGQVLRLTDSQTLKYNSKASLLNSGFVVIGDPSADWPSRLSH